jgi:hypothetical protein
MPADDRSNCRRVMTHYRLFENVSSGQDAIPRFRSCGLGEHNWPVPGYRGLRGHSTPQKLALRDTMNVTSGLPPSCVIFRECNP